MGDFDSGGIPAGWTAPGHSNAELEKENAALRSDIIEARRIMGVWRDNSVKFKSKMETERKRCAAFAREYLGEPADNVTARTMQRIMDDLAEEIERG